MDEVIVCAAIRHNKTGVIIASIRHFDDIMRNQIKQLNPTDDKEIRIEWNGSEQGFLTNKYRFVSRQEAWEIALKQGQIKRKVSSEGKLYSENLY